MKNHLKRIQIVLLICAIMVLAGCYHKPHTQKEVEKYVAQNVPEEAELVSHYERKSNNGTEYVYVFKSKTRDLKFNVYSTIGGSSLTGYSLSEYYMLGLRDYYLEKMRPILRDCNNSEMSLKPDSEKVSTKLYLKDESDAKYLSPFLAGCNDIAKEEFNYQPGADLSRTEVLGLYFTFYSSADMKEKIGTYYINGMDDEDAVYRELVQLLK